jgi:hypothetical protein
MFVKALEEHVGTRIFMMETQIGTLPIEVVRRDNAYWVKMTQGLPSINDPLALADQ